MHLNRKCRKKYVETQNFDFLNKTVKFFSYPNCLFSLYIYNNGLNVHQYFYLVLKYLKFIDWFCHEKERLITCAKQDDSNKTGHSCTLHTYIFTFHLCREFLSQPCYITHDRIKVAWIQCFGCIESHVKISSSDCLVTV